MGRLFVQVLKSLTQKVLRMGDRLAETRVSLLVDFCRSVGLQQLLKTVVWPEVVSNLAQEMFLDCLEAFLWDDAGLELWDDIFVDLMVRLHERQRTTSLLKLFSKANMRTVFLPVVLPRIAEQGLNLH